MKLIEEIEKRSILILGLGREGVSTFTFLRKRLPHKVLGLADKLSWQQLDKKTREIIKADRNTALFLGDSYLKSLSQYEIIFKSSGIYPSELEGARKAGKRISSNTELFFDCCSGITIGITGTKGKSTTSSLIDEVLKRGGFDTHLIGNIGMPPLTSLAEHTSTTIFVSELSSYQLINLHKSPHIAVVQNIVREHLDYHGSFEAYLQAKENIISYQNESDYVLFNASFPLSRKMAKKSKAKKLPFGLSPRGEIGCFVEEGSLVFSSRGVREKVISVQSIPLKGQFNLQNVMPAIIIGKIFGVPNKIIATAIKSFKPLEHRLEFVRTCHGVAFYNDSLSTIPEATIAAMEAFLGRKLILLLGGYDRGQDFKELAQKILINNVKAVVLFPTTGERIWNDIVLQNRSIVDLPKCVLVTSMRDAVQEAYNLAEKGDVVLLSPASASFGVFRDYADRGNQFKVEVRKLLDQSKSNIFSP